MIWNIFCRVIDNYGDLGVCWRLAVDLATRGETVNLWVDDASMLEWLAPEGHPGVCTRQWPDTQPLPASHFQAAVCNVLVEAFGCTVPEPFVRAFAHAARGVTPKPLWLNLEHLSAQSYVERNHGLESWNTIANAEGIQKNFFYPGFTQKSGGLLREPDLLQRRADFNRSAWLRDQGIEMQSGTKQISLFCYETLALMPLVQQLSQCNATNQFQYHVLATAGRASAALRAALVHPSYLHCMQEAAQTGVLTTSYLPFYSQRDYDHLLWASDLNIVRGEDSLVRAIWAGKPFVWHIYPQSDGAHHAKLEAFLDMMQAPSSLRHFHRVWNGLQSEPLPAIEWHAWGQIALALRHRLQSQTDLASQLLAFAQKIR